MSQDWDTRYIRPGRPSRLQYAAGRPAVSPTLRVRVTPAMDAALEHLAQHRGMTKAALTREALAHYIGSRTPPPQHPEST